MQKSAVRLPGWLLAGSVLLVAPTVAQPVEIESLGTFYHVSDVSDDGSVVVATYRLGPVAAAFRIEDGVYENLRDVGERSEVNGISGDGLIALGQNRGPSAPREALRWKILNPEGLGFLKPATVTSESAALSSTTDGELAVGWSQTHSLDRTAVVWKRRSIQELRRSSSYTQSVAYDITPTGHYVVGSTGQVPARWSEPFLSLPTVFGVLSDRFDSGDAFAVSDDGRVFVGEFRDGLGASLPFRWEDGFEELGQLVPGTELGAALDVNGAGGIVVGASGPRGNDVAFIWDRPGGQRPLASFLEDDLGLDLTSYVLQEATAISRDGTAIVGRGIENGTRTYWKVTLPVACSNRLDDDGDGLVDEADSVCASGENPSEQIRYDLRFDVEPHRDGNEIFLGSRKPVLTALMGGPAVDVRDIDSDTIRLRAERGALVSAPALSLRWDIDRDGHRDLLMWFRIAEITLGPQDDGACVTGLIDEDPFESCTPVSVLEGTCGQGGVLPGALASVIPLAALRARRSRHRRSRTGRTGAASPWFSRGR